jgi:hypothetical protein
MATTYYRYNALTRVLTAEPRYIVTIDGRTIVNPTAEQYATLRDAYQKGDDAPKHEPQEGKVVEYGGYALGEDSKWHKQWTLVDAPPKPPRRWSRLAIKTALAQAGMISQVLAYLAQMEIATGYSAAEALQDCDYIEEGYPDTTRWAALLDGAANALGKTRAEIDAFLDNIQQEA